MLEMLCFFLCECFLRYVCVGNLRECSSDNKDTIFNQHNDKLYMSAGGLYLFCNLVVMKIIKVP